MTFDNSRTIIAARIRLFIATLLLLAYMVLAFAAEIIKFPVLGLSETVITLILVGIYMIIAIYPLVLNYQYISYSDDEEKIVIRYFNAGIVGGKKNSVEINKSDFAGYRRDKQFFGLIQSITLFHQYPQGVAKYPPVFISNLSRKERARLLNSLYLLTPHDAEEAKK
ncbi:MAG: hypothetical protein ABR974_05510 [Bacteroidales bacterium]|jgi:hypothetical protein